ncbi:MAG: J domain-containing protein, partial [Planctomycetota bacterium]
GSGWRAAASAGGGTAPRPPPRIVPPHEILGLAATASLSEIRERFRSLALQYHPDKAAHLGEEFERAAHEKFLRLKQAYESLVAQRSRRGGREA